MRKWIATAAAAIILAGACQDSPTEETFPVAFSETEFPCPGPLTASNAYGSGAQCEWLTNISGWGPVWDSTEVIFDASWTRDTEGCGTLSTSTHHYFSNSDTIMVVVQAGTGGANPRGHTARSDSAGITHVIRAIRGDMLGNYSDLLEVIEHEGFHAWVLENGATQSLRDAINEWWDAQNHANFEEWVQWCLENQNDGASSDPEDEYLHDESELTCDDPESPEYPCEIEEFSVIVDPIPGQGGNNGNGNGNGGGSNGRGGGNGGGDLFVPLPSS